MGTSSTGNVLASNEPEGFRYGNMSNLVWRHLIIVIKPYVYGGRFAILL